MTETKVPANVKKMIQAISKMEQTIFDQKQQIFKIEKEFAQFKKFAGVFIENIKKTHEKKPRKPSGFVLPVPISDELCHFLDISGGSHVARTEVTKFIISYITEHNLVHPERKTIVVPDDRLGNLLGPDVDPETLTRFTLQKYMNRHYLLEQKNV